MKKCDVSQASHFMQLLARREAELGALLTTGAAATLDAGEDAPHEVVDFKDLATQDMLATVGEAQTVHAQEELQQVLAARRRLLDDSYGLCLDCGKSIDLQRLNVLPAAARCTACQSLQEQIGLKPR